MTLTQKEI